MVRLVQGPQARITVLLRAVEQVFKAYAGIEEHTTKQEKKEKIEQIASSSLIYFIHYYWRAVAFFTVTVTLRSMDVHAAVIFFVGWMFNITPAFYFIAGARLTGNDISLGQNVRKALDVVREKNTLVWMITLVAIVFKVTLMDGPEKAIMIFRKELQGGTRLGLALGLHTALQTILWQTLIYFGYKTAENTTPIIFAIAIWYALAVKRYFSRPTWDIK